MFEAGTMTLGVNYWASHAATRMWTQWDAETVENDFKALAQIGCRVLRVFPLWPDFQPVMVLRTNCVKGGHPRAYAFTGERPLPDTEAGRAGVDETMMERFETLADLAERYGMKLIVPLLNGHMTFRVYFPPAVDGLDAFTDPASLMWQLKFIRYFVGRMKHHPAIHAWEIGNESNCMSVADSRAAAWSWSAVITDAIRAGDPNRPVFSGMHSLQLHEKEQKWLIADQAELCDSLTSHPYTMWRSYINCDPPNTLRWAMLSATENQLYADIGKRPCFVEEIGTLRRNFSSFEALGRQLCNMLWLLWANDAKALLWWCAFDQTAMEFPPYDWDEAGMEHGVMTAGYGLNPTGEAISGFSRFLDSAPVRQLPLQKRHAVCIFGRGQSHYELANAINIPAKQAGVNLQFTFCEDELPESQLYMIPCVQRKGGLNRAAYRLLRERVEAGATLYLSFDYNVSIPEMKEFFGLEIASREKVSAPTPVQLPDGIDFELPADYRFTIAPAGAEALDKNGLFWQYQCGKGRIVVAALPLELLMLAQPGSFQHYPLYRFYRQLAAEALKERIIRPDDWPEVVVSEHPESAERVYAILCNCSPQKQELRPQLADSWQIAGFASDHAEARLGNGVVTLPPNSGILLTLHKQEAISQ